MQTFGMGHNMGPELKNKKPDGLRQLEPTSTCILDIPLAERQRRRCAEAMMLVTMGPYRRKAVPAAAVAPRDHHKRFDVWGRARCHKGCADDLTTVARDDDLSDHLYTADEPYLRAGGMAEYQAYEQEDEEEPREEARGADDIEVPKDLTGGIPGVFYSTASPQHKANLTAAAA